MPICCVSLILRRCGVRSRTSLADSPTRRRGKKSLLIRRDATLRISRALHLGIFEQPAKNDFFSNMIVFKVNFVFLSYLSPANAVAVISMWAPAGSDFTSTVVRPGGLALKYSA